MTVETIGQRRRNRRKTVVEPAMALAESANTPPQMLIDIDQSVLGGIIHGRFDLQIRGRVVSPDPIEEVQLLSDGGPVERVLFDVQSATRALIAGRTAVRQYGYQFSLPRLRERADAPCRFIVRVRTIAGATYDEAFELAVDPTGPEPVTVVSGPIQPSAGYADARPPIVLYVERALLDAEGELLVHGWSVALTPMVSVQAFIGKGEWLSAVDTSGQRDDVAEAYPEYPNARASGFSLSAHLDAARTENLAAVLLRATCLGGYSHEVMMPLEHETNRLVISPQSAASDAAQTPPVITPDGPVASPWWARMDYHIPPDPKPALPPADEEMTRSADPEMNQPGDPRHEIHYVCEDAGVTEDGTLTVGGWAVCAVGIANIGIHIDGQKAGDAELILPRPDVAEVYATIPMARHSGFQFAQRIADLAEGEHDVQIVIRNGMDDIRKETKSVYVSKLVGSPSLEPPPRSEETIPLPGLGLNQSGDPRRENSLRLRGGRRDGGRNVDCGGMGCLWSWHHEHRNPY